MPVGISVLIPVYDYNPHVLLESLIQQASSLAVPVEIWVADDGSPVPVAQRLPADISARISLHRNDSNQGRAATRRTLAELAAHDYLLFIDADSEIPDNQFLERYAGQLSSLPAVVTGGRIYPDRQPSDCRLALHWTYGHRRESRANAGGARKAALQSNNFLIRRDLFLNLRVPEGLTGYGHEDTYWGIQLREQGVEVRRIENPVIHAHLEQTDIFIQKAEWAVKALLLLERQVDHDQLTREVRLYRMYRRLKAWGLMGILSAVVRRRVTSIMSNFNSCKPSLWLFDAWRLSTLHHLRKK